MRNLTLIGTTLLFGALLSACGSGGGGTGGTTSTTTGEGGTGTTSTTTGTGGTTTGTGGTGTTSSSTGTGGTGTTTTTGSGGAGPGADHLLISEVCVTPNGAEFIEIENPTSAAVDLSDYYVSDNATYHGIAAGQPFLPPSPPPLATPETDFLARFPPGTMIPAGGLIVIATSRADGSAAPGGATSTPFEQTYSKCPDFVIAPGPLTCGNGIVPTMIVPTNGAIGNNSGLSNSREMVILFRWDGSSAKVQDVDYVTWGMPDDFDVETRIDKTNVTGYAADTARNMQKPAAAHGAGASMQRCGSALEPGEKTTGGNGITGHDETSEPFDLNFRSTTTTTPTPMPLTPTPGVKNACL